MKYFRVILVAAVMILLLNSQPRTYYPETFQGYLADIIWLNKAIVNAETPQDAAVWEASLNDSIETMLNN